MNPELLRPVADHLWQSTLFAAVAGLLTLTLRGNRARVRYWVWLAASCKFLAPLSVLVALGGLIPLRTVPASTEAGLFIARDVAAPFTIRGISAPLSPQVPAARSALPLALLVIWTLGFAGIVFSWWIRWRRICKTVRSARPAPLLLSVPVRCSAGVLEPGVLGIYRPILLLPDGIFERLSPPQMQAILAHELSHIRCRDNLTAAIHMFVEAIFWFHPLVWWIEKRMVEERERACDEEVLRFGSDPRVYAEGILNVCKLYTEPPLQCCSGVSGSNLRKRIVMILSNRAMVNLSPAKKGILTFAGLAALALPITLGMLRTPAVRAQSASTGRSTPSEPQGGSISFEVASVKPSRSSDPDGSLDFEKDGRLVAHNVPLKALIAEAYHVRAENLSGAPGWLESERFDVVAKAPPATPPDDLRRMMIALLQERFKLATHIEQKLMPGYSLLVGKKGTNLEKSAPARSVDGGCERARPATPGDVAVQCQNMSMADLADVLPDIAGGYIQGPVVDQTGLQGFYDFRLNWTPAGLLKGNTGGSRNPSRTGSGASVFDAIQDQIGLRLESKKLLLPVVVIDHVERTPTEN